MARVLKGSHSFTCTPRIHPQYYDQYYQEATTSTTSISNNSPAGGGGGSLTVELAAATAATDFLGTGSLATSSGLAAPLANFARDDEGFAAIAEVFFPRAPAVGFFATLARDVVKPASPSSELSGSSGEPASGDRDRDLAAAGLAVLERFLPAYTSPITGILLIAIMMIN